MTARRRRDNEVMHRAEDWGARDEDHEQRIRSLEFLGRSHELPWVRRRYTSTGRPDGALVCGSLNDIVISYNDTDAPAAPDPSSLEVQGSDDWEVFFQLFTGSQIKVLNAGHYTVSVKLKWTSTTAFGRYVTYADGGTFDEILQYILPINELSSHQHAVAFTERYPANQTLQIGAANGHATLSQEIAWAYFEVRYDAAYTGPDTNDIDDPDPVE